MGFTSSQLCSGAWFPFVQLPREMEVQFWMFLPELLEKFHLLFFSLLSLDQDPPTQPSASLPIPFQAKTFTKYVSLANNSSSSDAFRVTLSTCRNLMGFSGFLGRSRSIFFFRNNWIKVFDFQNHSKKSRCSNYQLGS